MRLFEFLFDAGIRDVAFAGFEEYESRNRETFKMQTQDHVA